MIAVAACKFKWSKDGQTYDYLIPPDLILKAGDKVIVETRRGEATVEVVEIKDESDKATAFIVRLEDPETDTAEEWNF